MASQHDHHHRLHRLVVRQARLLQGCPEAAFSNVHTFNKFTQPLSSTSRPCSSGWQVSPIRTIPPFADIELVAYPLLLPRAVQIRPQTPPLHDLLVTNIAFDPQHDRPTTRRISNTSLDTSSRWFTDAGRI